MTLISDTPQWHSLETHAASLAHMHMRELFAADADRFDRFSLQLDDLLLDFSKNRITAETLDLLRALAEAAELSNWIEQMFTGARINATEDRPVLHTALRNRNNTPVMVDGQDIMPAVNAVLARVSDFTAAVREKRWLGFSGEPIRAVVNIGIGGSDLGPAMVTKALSPWQHPDLEFHFVSNVDGAQIDQVLKGLDPRTTLFIVASKTFTTQETMTNAATARAWLLDSLGDEAAVARHFVAVSTNEKEVRSFGIDPDKMFVFWDWVGGRYSLWSAIGLPIALSIGMERFEELLTGAHAMDRHFRTEPFASNLPVTLALIGLWNSNFLGAATQAVVPYSHLLRRFPAFLQQLEMESNGKRASKEGAFVPYETGSVLWGEPGTNGQHAFFQLLHQGTRLVPVDLIAVAQGEHLHSGHQDILIANALAQSSALMLGKTGAEARAELEAAGLPPDAAESLAPHKTYPGNQPSNTILLRRLDPHSLGMLIALYEHKVFVQGVLWDIYSFDQWGVEFGKAIANKLLPALQSNAEVQSEDVSTSGLMNAYRNWR